MILSLLFVLVFSVLPWILLTEFPEFPWIQLKRYWLAYIWILNCYLPLLGVFWPELFCWKFWFLAFRSLVCCHWPSSTCCWGEEWLFWILSGQRSLELLHLEAPLYRSKHFLLVCDTSNLEVFLCCAKCGHWIRIKDHWHLRQGVSVQQWWISFLLLFLKFRLVTEVKIVLIQPIRIITV